MNALDMVRAQIGMLPQTAKQELLDELAKESGRQDLPKESVVSIPAAAKRISKTKRTIHNLIQDGFLIPFKPIGRKRAWGVTSKSLDAFIANAGNGDQKHE